MRRLALPDDLVAKLVLPEYLVEHDLDVVGGVPVAVVVEGACGFEDAVEFDAAGAHEVDVGLCGGVAVVEGAFFLGFAPEDFVVAVGVEGGIDVDEVDAVVGESAEVVEVVAAIDDAAVEEGRGFGGLMGFGGLLGHVDSPGMSPLAEGIVAEGGRV